MIIDTNIKLVNMNGAVLQDNDGTGKLIDATVKTAIVNAILVPTKDETGMDKVKKYELAKKVFNSDKVDLDEQDIAFIKEAIGKNYPPLVVGQVYELLKV